jgi:hypothetical protein
LASPCQALKKKKEKKKEGKKVFAEAPLAGYLANVAGPVPLVLDLRIAHERFGSSSDPSINGHLLYVSY